MKCSEFLNRFSEYYDDRVELPLRREMDEHVRRCSSCRRYLEVVQRGVRHLRDQADGASDASMPPPVPQRLRAVLKAPFEPETEASGSLPGAGRWVAAAAVILLVGGYGVYDSITPPVDPIRSVDSESIVFSRGVSLPRRPAVRMKSFLPATTVDLSGPVKPFQSRFAGSPPSYPDVDFTWSMEWDPVRLSSVE